MSFWTAIGLGGGTYHVTAPGADTSTTFKAGSDKEALAKTKEIIEKHDLTSAELSIHGKTVAIATKDGYHSITTDGTQNQNAPALRDEQGFTYDP